MHTVPVIAFDAALRLTLPPALDRLTANSSFSRLHGAVASAIHRAADGLPSPCGGCSPPTAAVVSAGLANSQLEPTLESAAWPAAELG